MVKLLAADYYIILVPQTIYEIQSFKDCQRYSIYVIGKITETGVLDRTATQIIYGCGLVETITAILAKISFKVHIYIVPFSKPSDF